MAGYSKIPTLSAWKSDSSVVFAIRSSDPILSRIDALLDVYEKFSARRLVTLCDLYYCTEYWLKAFKQNRSMEGKRQPAVQRLFQRVELELSTSFQCEPKEVANQLQLTFGRDMTTNGLNVDLLYQKANYPSRTELQTYRIYFKGGDAYQWDWWDKSLNPPKRKLLESKYSYRPGAFVGSRDQQPCVDYGGFVLTLSREFYMGPHKQGKADEQNGFYNSSYVAGEPVKGAGTMLVQAGKIKRLRCDSGHYKPIDTNMLEVLQALQMFGVDCHGIMVEDFSGNYARKATEFLAARGDWDVLFGRGYGRVANRNYNELRSELIRDRQQELRTSAVSIIDNGYNATEE